MQGLPPVVILTGTAAPAVLTNVYPLPVLTGPLLLTGSFADGTKVPEWPAEVDFRASQGTPILPVGPSGDLMIQMMVSKKQSTFLFLYHAHHEQLCTLVPYGPRQNGGNQSH